MATIIVTGEPHEGENRDLWNFDVAHLDQDQIWDLVIDAVARSAELQGVTMIEALSRFIVTSTEADSLRQRGAMGITIMLVSPEELEGIALQASATPPGKPPILH